jgi:hypothetical protein
MKDGLDDQSAMWPTEGAAAIVSAFRRDMRALKLDIEAGLIHAAQDVHKRIEAIHARHWRLLAQTEGHCLKLPKLPNNSYSLEVQALNMRAKIKQDEGITEREIKRKMALTPTEYDARVEWLLRNDCKDSGAYLIIEGKGGKARLFSSEKAQRKYHADRAQARLDLRREISLGGIDAQINKA